MRLIKLNTMRLKLSSIRLYSSSTNSSKFVRQQFLDFFIKDNNHKFVKSSSVIPFCDPTLSFCNAGMNQFKNILLGNQDPRHRRVANSQKCIRVGGKHNDLEIVGSDSYHHTFFEMLGNWSFGDYFKKDACEMAWKLLTEVYKIPPERLYVTYFKGDESMGLEPDLECKDIWRLIGLPEDRIIGFGAKENFWEMGATGPCGGCSEIHVDHLPSFRNLNRAVDVNQDKSDLTELWNIVFIEYFRNADRSVEKLPEKHIDTGMGFERLVSFLQGKRSNYDSDLFTPLFQKIHKATGASEYSGAFDGPHCQLDTSYRVLADHSRMVAVSIADGMFPEQNQKLRRIVRKCIRISEEQFKDDNLLLQTIPVVSEILGETFNELNDRLSTVSEIIKYEQEVYRSLRDAMAKDVKSILKQNPRLAVVEFSEYPSIVQGYREFKSYKNSNKNLMTSDFMFFMYTSFGFDLELMEKLATLEDMKADTIGFQEKLAQVKKASKDQHSNENLLMKLDVLLKQQTDNDLKYKYSFDGERQMFHVAPVTSRITSIVNQNESISSTRSSENSLAKVIVDQSPFYYESGGQESDAGYICKNGQKFQLKTLSKLKNCVLHEVELSPGESLEVGDEVELHVDNEKRSALTRNHSAAHLLNAAVRKVANSPTYQKSSHVTSDSLRIELICLGPKMKHESFEQIEELIRQKIIGNPLASEVRVLNSQDLQEENNVLMVPGEIYPPDGIRLIKFEEFSKELCCGTHVFNTSEIIDFTFLSMRSPGRSSYFFTAITGQEAKKALAIGEQLVIELKSILEKVSADNIDKTLSELRDVSIRLNNSDLRVSFLKKLECQKLTEDIKMKVKRAETELSDRILNQELKSLLENNPNSKFFIHFIKCPKNDALNKATNFINDRPVMFLSYNDNSVRARCNVPQQFITETFNAEKWLQGVAQVFDAALSLPKTQSSAEICQIKAKNVHPKKFDGLLKQATEAAKEMAKHI